MIAAAVALAVLAAGTSTTRSDWTVGAVTGAGSARTGALAFGHTYQDTSCSQGERTAEDRACPGSIAPTAATTSSGVTATDTITNAGTVEATQLHAEVRAASCAPVQLANRADPGNPLLPRYGTTFHSSGGPLDNGPFISIDGGAPGGYATSMTASVQPGGGLLSVGTVSGVGVWFKATSAGPLASFSSSPSNGSGRSDRALYLSDAGTLRLVWNESRTETLESPASYTDGSWHFAHVSFAATSINLGVLAVVIPQVTLSVDGARVDTTPLVSLDAMSSYSGYWHLGWAPTATTDLTVAYGDADLSNFFVDNTGAIPDGASIGVPTTQTAFDTAIGSVTDHWLLADTGATTYPGALPTEIADPCSQVQLDWAFAGPAGTAASGTPLSTFADGVWRPVAAPPPGSTQTSTITTTRGSGWHSDLAGLRLHAPLSYRVRTTPAGAWSQTFTWSGAEAAFLA